MKVLKLQPPIEVETNFTNKDGVQEKKTQKVDQDPIELDNDLSRYVVFNPDLLLEYLNERVKAEDKEVRSQASIIMGYFIENAKDKILMVETDNGTIFNALDKNDIPDLSHKAVFNGKGKIIQIEVKLKDVFEDKKLIEL